AAWVAFVARRPADLIHLEQDGVGVTIDKNAFHLLDVAAFFSFAPQLAAAAGEVNCPAGGKRFFVAFAIHIGEHQHLARLGILCDRRQEAAIAFGEIGNLCGLIGHGGLLTRWAKSAESTERTSIIRRYSANTGALGLVSSW